AVTNDNTPGAVSVLHGIGDGSFAAPLSYATGSGSNTVVVADFNEDGIADLAVTNRASGTLSILLGHGSGGVGDGTFAAATSITLRPQPTAMTTGDFDRDGITDLAIVTAGSGVSVLRGRGSGAVGDGTFNAAVNYSVGLNSFGLTSGDFDGDGILDLVVSRQSSSATAIDLLRGNGDGPSAAAVEFGGGAAPGQLATADLDGDGLADVASTSNGANAISMMLGAPGATFDGPQAFSMTGL